MDITKTLAALAVFTVTYAGLAGGQSATADGYTLDDFQRITMQNLRNICTLDSGHADYHEALSFCYGYLEGGRGYHDGLVAIKDYSPIVCPPEGATRRDAVGVFVAFAEEHPEHSDKPAMQMVVRALATEWPCAN